MLIQHSILKEELKVLSIIVTIGWLISFLLIAVIRSAKDYKKRSDDGRD